jgi:diguanylate cyclase
MDRDLAEAKRAKMAAEQAVSRMDGRLRHKLKPHVKQGLVNAILKSDAQDDLLFRNTPARFTPSAWSLTGLLSRLALIWNRRHNRGTAEDQRAALAQTYARVRQSGAVALVIALGVALLVGVVDFGKPAEIGLQAIRNSVRPLAASGNIVVITKDDKSAKIFGGWPWPRRYDAALVDRLRAMGAKTILFDQLFADPTNPVDDQAFAAALDRAGGKVWLSVRFVENSITGERAAIVPTPILRSRTRQAHGNTWRGLFGYAENIPFTSVVGGKEYPSSPSILAESVGNRGALRPDYAIDYKTIPTISAADIVLGRVDRAMVAGKTIVIGAVSFSIGDVYPILGQGAAAGVYSRVIAAETIKNGVAWELGYLPALLCCGLIGFFCVINHSRRKRVAILAIGTTAIIAMVFIGDRVGLHYELVPALFALISFGIRESIYGKLIIAETTNPISGLPNLSETHYLKNREACAVGAIKVEQYGQIIEALSTAAQRILILAIAARINIMCPNSVVHQGEDGLFIWLIPPDAECDLGVVGGQINALFMVPVVGLDRLHDVGVSVGVIRDMNLKFGERLAVAIDRAKVPVYVTLREVL